MKTWGDQLARVVDLRVHDPVADTTALGNLVPADRNDGQSCVVVADYSEWTYQSGSSAVTGTTVVVPADAPATGRWIRTRAPQAAGALLVQTGTVTLVAGTKTLATGIVVSANTVVLLSRKTQGGTVSSTIMYEAPSASRVVGAAGVGTIVFNASVAAGTVANTDTSVLDYVLIG